VDDEFSDCGDSVNGDSEFGDDLSVVSEDEEMILTANEPQRLKKSTKKNKDTLKKPIYSCTSCNRSFYTLEGVKNHMTQHRVLGTHC